MNKELEALKYIENFNNKRFFNATYDNGDQTHYEYQTIKDLFPKEFEIIETALKEQEEDKKLLNEQAKTNRYLMEQIKQSQNKLKALFVIKERFTIQFIKSDCLPNYYGIMQIGTNPIYIKTKEEYELLKEVLL